MKPKPIDLEIEDDAERAQEEEAKIVQRRDRNREVPMKRIGKKGRSR